MNTDKPHQKIGLAGHGDCKVILCPECGTLEINLGSSTIRTNSESLHLLSSVLNHAKVRLAQIQATPSENNRTESDRVH
ncbi:MAG: hypothetical protein ACXWF8_04795 [Methylobacter sp.]